MSKEITIKKDFVSSDYNLKDEKCNPPYDMNISLSKQKHDGHEESFWITVYGKWDDDKSQFDLALKSKNECIKFLNNMSRVIKQEY